jgi:hypothetical protein
MACAHCGYLAKDFTLFLGFAKGTLKIRSERCRDYFENGIGIWIVWNGGL